MLSPHPSLALPCTPSPPHLAAHPSHHTFSVLGPPLGGTGQPVGTDQPRGHPQPLGAWPLPALTPALSLATPAWELSPCPHTSSSHHRGDSLRRPATQTASLPAGPQPSHGLTLTVWAGPGPTPLRARTPPSRQPPRGCQGLLSPEAPPAPDAHLPLHTCVGRCPAASLSRAPPGVKRCSWGRSLQPALGTGSHGGPSRGSGQGVGAASRQPVYPGRRSLTALPGSCPQPGAGAWPELQRSGLLP